MNVSVLLNSPHAIGMLSFLAGIVGTIITTQILARRSLFTYFVTHNRVGLSVNDPIFGSVQVTLNNDPIAHLYHSTVELVNNSFKDFQQVVVTIYSADTKLLSQSTAIVDTPQIARFTDAYSESIRVPEGERPTPAQFDIWNRRREYLLPTFNRGQTVRCSYLNAAVNEAGPSIWLNINHPGVRVRFHAAAETFWGVPRPRAALAGMLFGTAVLTVLLTQAQPPWFIGVAAFVLGLFAQMPGAAVVRAWRWLRGWYGG